MPLRRLSPHPPHPQTDVATDSIAPKPVARERTACKLKHAPQFARALDGLRFTFHALPHPPAPSPTQRRGGAQRARRRHVPSRVQRTPLRLERGRGEVGSAFELRASEAALPSTEAALRQAPLSAWRGAGVRWISPRPNPLFPLFPLLSARFCVPTVSSFTVVCVLRA